jgi:hypothetical protein
MINLDDLPLPLLGLLLLAYPNLDQHLLRLLLISVLARLLGNLLRLVPARGSGLITHSLRDSTSVNKLNYNHLHDLLMHLIPP